MPTRAFRRRLIFSRRPSNLTSGIHLFPLHTSAASRAQLPIHQTISRSKSSSDFHHLKQTLANIITSKTPIDPVSLMKFIDISLSSSVSSSFCSLLFTQFMDSITAETCSSITKTYTSSNKHLHSILVYTLMFNAGILPDTFSLPVVLKSVAQLAFLKLGKSIHGYILVMGFQSDVFSNTALLHMYSTCKSLDDAHQLFNEMPERNSVTWNAIITGCTHNRKFREALVLFREMQILGVEPTEVTMVSALSACAHLGALSQGKWIHNYINHNNVRLNVFVGTALIDMYGKCGSVSESEKVFQVMRTKNVYTWNALISGFAINGQGEAALEVFSKMIEENLMPDGVTFLAILCACCHQGLINEGEKFFTSMNKFGLQPNVEHYGCMVDLLGRAGFLDEAQNLIRSMPVKPDGVIWRALLGACRIHGNAKLGELAIENLLQLEPYNAENYVLLSNLYARDRRWSKVGEVRELMSSRRIQKIPGCSSIEVDNVVYEFVVAGQFAKGGSGEIYKMLADMSRKLRWAGYVAETEMVSYDVEEEEKEGSLMYHSEKLALAFGLLRTSCGSDIRIVKNLRVCRDCHNFFKLVSKAYQRNIIVRDRNRFHHFGAGLCSCRDYW